MPSRISVLGNSDLRREDGALAQSVLHQPRRFALLVYLALASRQGPVRRDRVMAVFWADKPQDKARGALNQAVHYLRRSLGQDAIVTTADTIELDRTLVTCDAAEFMDAIDAEQWKGAVDLYAGDLLPGFFDSLEAIDFERWLEGERDRLQRAASNAAWHLAKEAEASGAMADAVVWARRACEWSANDETEVRRLMTFMAALGDRTGVLDAYDGLKAVLRPLELEPAPETTELIRSLRRTWEEEDAAVPADEPVVVKKSSMSAVPGGKPGKRASGRWGGLRRLQSAAVTLVLTFALISLWGLRRSARPAENAQPSILVESLKAEADAPVATGALSDQVVTHLQSMTALNVVDGTAGNASRGGEADFVLRGGVVRMGGQMQVNMHLVDAKTGRAVASEQFDRNQPDQLATLDELSAAIANFARRSIGTIEEERRIAGANASPEAITLVQLGRGDLRLADSLRNAGVDEAASASYEKADSTFLEAADRADSWAQPWIERARVAQGEMWLEILNPGSSTSEAAGVAALKGVEYAAKAVKLSGNSVEALEVRANLEWWAWRLRKPNADEKVANLLDRAEQDAREVTVEAPRRAGAWNLLGGIALMRGEWGDAYWALTRAITADAYLKNNMEIVLRLFTAAWETNNVDAARSWCDLISGRLGPTWPTAYCQLHLDALRTTVDTALVDSLRTGLQETLDWTRVQPSFDALAAVIFARSGNVARAERLLEEADPTAQRAGDATMLAAWAWLELGNRHTARSLLERYVDALPVSRSGALRSRRFNALAAPAEN